MVDDVGLGDGARVLLFFLELVAIAGVILPTLEPLLRHQKNRHALHNYRVFVLRLHQLLKLSPFAASDGRLGHLADCSFETGHR